jgi:hypothetical protein
MNPSGFCRSFRLIVNAVLMITLQIFPYKVEKTPYLAVSFADMDTREYNSQVLKIGAISFHYELVM